MTEVMVRPSFQELIESVEALSIEDREMLVGIISKRIIEQRREDLVQIWRRPWKPVGEVRSA